MKDSPYSLHLSNYPLHLSKDVPNEVRKTAFEMGKMLDVLSIEIAGIEAKMTAIEEYSTQAEGRVTYMPQKLREMMMQEKIELVGAETRRRAILNIKKREEALYYLYNAWNKLDEEHRRLERRLKDDKGNLRAIEKEEKELVGLGLKTRPFNIQDNKIIIYPVRADLP